MTGPAFQSDHVLAAFERFPRPVRAALLDLRAAIFDCAQNLPQVGALTETLKWGQPAYLTEASGSGTTLRLGVPKTGGFAILVHCQTDLVPQFRAVFGDAFTYDGTRAVVFGEDDAPDLEKLGFLIGRALTYHLDKRAR
ncbi:DUF1801 domain-containing protein [Litorivita sp. NS0012-18]|uniref:DUF1801 domain-containing protein n=1 Tax=Litorivita sp. NS0012-18 TaxID=3127655 RepID=UPI003104F3DF